MERLQVDVCLPLYTLPAMCSFLSVVCFFDLLLTAIVLCFPFVDKLPWSLNTFLPLTLFLLNFKFFITNLIKLLQFFRTFQYFIVCFLLAGFCFSRISRCKKRFEFTKPFHFHRYFCIKRILYWIEKRTKHTKLSMCKHLFAYIYACVSLFYLCFFMLASLYLMRSLFGIIFEAVKKMPGIMNLL